jgi:hypothetical protein
MMPSPKVYLTRDDIRQIIAAYMQHSFGFTNTYCEVGHLSKKDGVFVTISEIRDGPSVTIEMGKEDFSLPVEPLVERLIMPALQKLAFDKWSLAA